MPLGNIKGLLLHPVTKRIAIAAPITFAIALLRAWMGEHSILLGLIVGVSAYAFADWRLSSKAEFEERWRGSWEFIKANQNVAITWCSYVLISAICFGTRPEPQEPAVQQILRLVQLIGLFAVIIVPTVKSTLAATTSRSWPAARALINGFLSSLTIYALALSFVGSAGDEVYRWVIANPDDATVGAVALVIIWMIIQFSSQPSYGIEPVAKSLGTAVPASRTSARKSTDRDRRYAAAHEAGHTLVYAALDPLPDDVQMTILDQSDATGTLGFVTRVKGPHQLEESVFAEWDMLVFLAGKIGESRLIGETTLGSSSDFTRWVDVAKTYLSNHYDGIYYPEPKNEFEQKHNVERLSALHKAQTARLNELFDQNAGLLRELNDALLEKRTLPRDELVPFLSRVALPSGFPRPFDPQGPHAGAHINEA